MNRPSSCEITVLPGPQLFVWHLAIFLHGLAKDNAPLMPCKFGGHRRSARGGIEMRKCRKTRDGDEPVAPTSRSTSRDSGSIPSAQKYKLDIRLGMDSAKSATESGYEVFGRVKRVGSMASGSSLTETGVI